MPEHIECVSCGTTLLAVESFGSSPIDRDARPRCGDDEFEFVN